MEGPKRNQKVLAPSYGLRCAQVPSLRLCSVGTPSRAIHGPSRLSRHPCRSAHSTEPPLGLPGGRADQKHCAARRPTGQPNCCGMRSPRSCRRNEAASGGAAVVRSGDFVVSGKNRSSGFTTTTSPDAASSLRQLLREERGMAGGVKMLQWSVFAPIRFKPNICRTNPPSLFHVWSVFAPVIR